ncbi:MAG: superoxide dismutase family protein [Bacteroidales bacterium]|nr:superoxide dismutase family protein [Bacteroidales bacterium]
MKKLQVILKILSAMSVVIFFSACQPKDNGKGTDLDSIAETQHVMNNDMDMQHEATDIQKAICVLYPTEGNDVHGTVTFEQSDSGVVVNVKIEGLTPGKHGFHIHEFGDCSASDGTSAGGHFNPTGMEHGSPTGEMRHVGDLGNLEANAEGKAEYTHVDQHLKLNGKNSILGRSIIVHADEDDLKTQPTGNAGARVACGSIGVMK